MKVLKVQMPDGTTWIVPFSTIVTHAAKWTADKVQVDIVTAKEIVTRLFDRDESIAPDWIARNMQWSDVESDAVQVDNPTLPYAEQWKNAEKKIVEVQQ